MYDDLFDDPKHTKALYANLLAQRGVKPKQQGRGGTLTSLISEGGGAGGATAGAAIGTAILPGIGTALGAGAGGLIGALTGRLAENKVRDNRWGVGDALKEGVLSGALSAVLPGASVAKNAFKKGAGEVLEGAGKAGTRKALERGSQAALADAWGIKGGAKLNGEVLGTKRAAELQKFLVDEVKVPKFANADRALEFAGRHSDDVGSRIAETLKTATGKVKPSTVGQNIEKKFSKVLAADYKTNDVAQRILKEVRSAKTPEDLWKSRLSVDELINFSRNSTSSVPGVEAFGNAARGEINKHLKDIVPEFGKLSRSYGNARSAIDLIAPAARTPKGVKLPGVLGSVGGRTVQAVKAGLGQAGVKAGGLAGALGSVPVRPLAKAAVPQLASGLLRQSPSTNDNNATMPTYQSNAVIDSEYDGIDDSSMDLSTETNDSPFAPENVESNIKSILANGGKMKDVQDYVSLVETLQKLNAPAKDIKKTEGQRARDEAASLTDDALAMFDQGSLVTGPLARLEGIKGTFNKADPETSTFNATVSALRGSIAKARAGTSFTPGEEKLLNQYAPKVGDSAQQLRTKLVNLQRIFGQAAEREYGTEYAPDNLISALQ